MNVKRLRKQLGPDVDVRRVGRKIEVTGGGLTYRLDGQTPMREAEAAEYLRSKIPVATIGGKR